jgi:MOSC domain-containing protein YiiM
VANQQARGEVVQVSVSRGGVPKRAVERAQLGELGLEGDRHNDRVGHGGPERAVCLLAMEVIERLRAEGHRVEPGALGENLTIRGIDWSEVQPGDRLRIGPALIEVTRFTTPCRNIASSFKDGDFTRILQQRHPGEARLYARVVEGGELAPGLPVEHLPPARSD